jgi:hypothetical protein
MKFKGYKLNNRDSLNYHVIKLIDYSIFWEILLLTTCNSEILAEGSHMEFLEPEDPKDCFRRPGGGQQARKPMIPPLCQS